MRARDLFPIVMVLSALIMASTAWSAASPSKLSYQAVLLTSGGQPVTAPVSVVFTIYDASSGGTALWSETRNVTPDASGRVNVMLGDNTPIADPVFGGPNRWLGIQVGADPEMTPRTQFAASAYSSRVSTVDGSSGGTMDGNLTLRSTSALEKDGDVAQAAQLTLISVDGDTIVVGPADQLVFRATNSSGAELMSASISGPNGPVLGIADPGGNIAEHSGKASSYFNGASKNVNAQLKRAEVGSGGVFMFDANGDTLLAAVEVAGQADISLYDPQFVAKNSNFAGARRVHISGSTGNVSSTGKLFVGQGNSSVASKRLDKVPMVPGDPYIVAGSGNTWGIGDNSALLGNNHHLDGQGCFLAGDSNDVQSDYSFALGTGNVVIGENNTIMGRSNRAQNASQSAIVGDSNFVGGQQNICFGKFNSIGQHPNSASNCSILGGQGDTIQYGANASIIAGDFQYMTGSTFSIIGAGRNNTIDNEIVAPANVDAAGIFSGSDNYVGNTWAFIGGGYSNSAIGLYSLCAGGNLNTSSGNQSTVCGGGSNTASGSAAVVSGGESGLASGQNSVVSGGFSNQATGAKSTVPGGHGCTAAGDYSFATGTEAKANNAGEFVWADNSPHQFPVATEPNFTPTSNDFLARAVNGFVFVTGVDGSGNSTSGAQLASGGGSWSSLSDANSKENLRPVDVGEVLDKIAQLNITTWNYKAQDDGIRHIGPMAQELYALFGVGEDERHITGVDADGIALAAIKALHKKTQELEAQTDEIDALRRQIAELKKTVEGMTQQR